MKKKTIGNFQSLGESLWKYLPAAAAALHTWSQNRQDFKTFSLPHLRCRKIS